MDDEKNYTPPVKDGEDWNLVIEAIGEKGDGIARIHGYVIFVPGTKLKDKVKVKIKKALPRVAFAEVVEHIGQTEQTENIKEPEVPEDTEDFGEE